MLHLAEVLERWRISPDQLLSGFGLTVEALSAPGARIDIPTLERVVERARELSGEPGLGFYLGLQMRISMHGYLGFAAMTARNVREALEVATRFTPTRTTALELRLQEHGKKACLIIEERASLGTARDVILVSLLIGIWQIGNALTGKKLTGTADVAFAEPPYWRRFATLVPGPVHFDQEHTQLVFDAAVLDLPLVMADAAAQRLAREQCERELDALGLGGQVVTQVRGLIAPPTGGLRSVAEVARALHVSPRTLKRKLAAQGTSYSALREELLQQKARVLLRSEELTVEQVAERLGYSNPANFTRAFRRWTGATPRGYRRRMADRQK